MMAPDIFSQCSGCEQKNISLVEYIDVFDQSFSVCRDFHDRHYSLQVGYMSCIQKYFDKLKNRKKVKK